MGVAGLAIVALVAVLVVPELMRGADSPEAIEVSVPVYEGELALSEAVSVASEPMVAIDRGSDWMSGGVYLADDSREEQYPYAQADCMGLTLVETGLTNMTSMASDDEATRSAIEDLLSNARGDLVQLPAYGGGSVEFLAVEREVGVSGEAWSGWTAARLFTGSGVLVTVGVLCASASDLDTAVTDFQERVSIVVDVA